MILHAMVNSMGTIGTLLLKLLSEGTDGYLSGNGGAYFGQLSGSVWAA